MLPHLNLDMEKKTWEKRDSYNPHITIVTALFDGRQTKVPHSVGIYDESWVDKLYRGIERNYNGTFGFICLTEKTRRFKEPIRQVRFSRSVDQYGWMSLMEQYRPDLCIGNRCTMGLDTIITGPLNDIFEYSPEKVALCTDPYHPHLVCNAITLATPEFAEEIWNIWLNDEQKILKECTLFGSPSEMVLLRKLYGNSPRIDDMFPGRIVSYRVDVASMNIAVEDTSIIYFHGTTKPHQVNKEWMRRHWV